jgi:hypothetical protein
MDHAWLVWLVVAVVLAIEGATALVHPRGS